MKEITLQGIAASGGIALGSAFILKREELRVERTKAANSKQELAKLETALAQATQELEELKQKALEQVAEEEAEIFEVHAMFLQDPSLKGPAEKKINENGLSAEAAWQQAVEQQYEKLAGLETEYMRARAADVMDVGQRVLRILLGVDEGAFGVLSEAAIIVADDLTPSDTIQLDKDLALAFCTAAGGPTSHSAILARSLGIPAVVGLGSSLQQVKAGDQLVVDGGEGYVVVHPKEQTASRYQQRAETLSHEFEQQRSAALSPAITADDQQVEVVANIGRPEDVKQALQLGAEGIGLLRTEFLYLDREDTPTESEQSQIYSEILAEMEERPVIARTLDVGGDKELPYIALEPEDNPFLGVRAIRLGLARPELLLTQLRSLLTAGHGHNLHIMFPMITTLDELAQSKSLLAQAYEHLADEGVTLPNSVPVGIMVETPAVVMMADLFAQEVDFFSIGTNDLTQYTFAAERTNASVAHLTDACHPAILRQVKRVIEASHQADIWTGMCGELAGDPQAIPLLLGLGLDEFSMGANAIPQAKSIIRRWSLPGARALAEEALRMRSAEEVRQMVEAAEPE